MKKLSKLKLNDVSVMNDAEMKNVVGGNSSGCSSTSILACSGTCTVNGQQGMCRNIASAPGSDDWFGSSWGDAWDYNGAGYQVGCTCVSMGNSYPY